MEGDESHVKLACVVSAVLFSILSSLSVSILWAVNWRPWRIYRFVVVVFFFVNIYFTYNPCDFNYILGMILLGSSSSFYLILA